MSAVFPLAELVVLLGGVVVFLQSRRRPRPAGRPLSLPYRDERDDQQVAPAQFHPFYAGLTLLLLGSALAMVVIFPWEPAVRHILLLSFLDMVLVTGVLVLATFCGWQAWTFTSRP